LREQRNSHDQATGPADKPAEALSHADPLMTRRAGGVPDKKRGMDDMLFALRRGSPLRVAGLEETVEVYAASRVSEPVANDDFAFDE